MITTSLVDLETSSVAHTPDCQLTKGDDYSPSASMKETPVLISTKNVPDSSSESLSGEENMNMDDLQQSLNAQLKIAEIEDDFDVITRQFEDSIYESLEKSNSCMLPCFNVVCEQDCNPRGSFCILDIGGSTLRVSIVNFLDDGTAECLVNESWSIEDSNKHLDRSFFRWVTQKFKFLVDDDMCSTLKNSRGKIKVGITWSFPIIQHTASNKGIVSDLGKGFSVCDEFKGGDLKDIFENCFADGGIPIEIYSIVNDSVSVFVTGSYFNNAKLGLVQGTGINSSFLVDQSLAGKQKIKFLRNTDSDKKVLINTEASFLGYHLHKYVSDVDRDMNRLWKVMGSDEYPPPHMTTDTYGVFQPLEMITSGRYIPEIIRRFVAEYFSDTAVPEAGSEYTLSAELLASLYRCSDPEKFRAELGKSLPLDNLKDDDLVILKTITKTVIYRASMILASYIIAMVRVAKFTHLEKLEISVVGSMLQYFPEYKETVLGILDSKAVQSHNIPKISFDFIKDSSIYGASIAAYVNQERMGL